MATYTAYFQKQSSRSVPLQPIIPTPYITITCIDTGWNDFGKNYRARLEVAPGDDRSSFICNLQVMPAVNNIPVDRLDSWVEALPTASLIHYAEAPQNSTDQIQFISLFARESDYKTLASWIRSPEEFYKILMQLSDVVFARQMNLYRQEVLSSLLNTDNFRLAVLRSGSAYQAFYRGHRWLRPGISQSLLDDSRLSFRFRSTLNGFETSNHELNIYYVDTPLYEDRIHCLIGVNGCGKTRLLKELLLTLGNRSDTSGLDVFIDNHQSSASSEVECNAPTFNRVLAFTSDLQRSYPTNTRTDSPFEYKHFSLVQTERETHTESESMARTLVTLTRETELLVNRYSRYDLLRQSLQGYVDIENIHIPLTPDAIGISDSIRVVDEIPWIRLADIIRAGGEQRNLELSSRLDENRELTFFGERNERIQLSSGQHVFFRFGLHFISYVDIGTLVILDEPETHLHPNLICDFMSLLQKILTLTKSVALIATHSPYVVREIPTHCVHTLTADDNGSIQVGGVYLKTLGASISSISEAVFGDATVDKYHELLAKQLADSGQTLDEIINSYRQILSPELLIQIRHELEDGDAIP